MGLGPSKAKIKDILEKSCNDEKDMALGQVDFIPHRNDYFSPTSMSASIITENSNASISLIEASSVEAVPITARTTTVNVTHYPYCAVGTLFVKFPGDNQVHLYTCFLIEANVLVTLASNVHNPAKGGRAVEVTSSFSKEKIKPANIEIFDEDNKKKDPSHNIAVITYPEGLVSDWIGVKVLSEGDLSDKDILLMASVGINSAQDANTGAHLDNVQHHDEGSQGNQGSSNEQTVPKYINNSEIHETTVALNSSLSEELNDPEKLARCPGAPAYYKGYDNGIYCVGFLDNNYYVRPITKSVFRFLVKCLYKGKQMKKKIHKNIEEDKIYKLDLSRNDFGPLDIKYLSEFDLVNLTQLDLSSNSIKPQGAFYLSQGKYPNLRILNLNFNEIGDEGITHISNAIFGSLEQLFLFHNNISSEGIKALCKADFIPNLLILSLSENPNIMDEGCKWIKENKNWTRLAILNLNRTGLTDASISQLSSSAMPSLRKIHLSGNAFTEKICNEIQAWKLTGLSIEYDNPRKKGKKRRHGGGSVRPSSKASVSSSGDNEKTSHNAEHGNAESKA